MKFFLFCVSVLVFLSATDALWCWRCINAKNNADCNRRGRIQFCLPNEKACFNEVRRDGNGWSFTKRCKQTTACSNNKFQNEKEAWLPTQCNAKWPISSCRCCCNFSGCNVAEFCKQNSDCAPLPSLPHGRKKCRFTRSYNDIGSICKFKCDKGYDMVGPSSSTCVRGPPGQRARFNNPMPRCVPQPCSTISAPQHTIMRCTNGNKVGSVCSFSCEHELEFPSEIPGNPPMIVPSIHYLEGPSSVICQRNSKWSSLPPVCVGVTCPLLTLPKNVKMNCTYKNSEGSVCSFFCDEKNKLSGPSSTLCKHVTVDQGVWTSPVPTCIRKRCSKSPRRPNNGSFVCTDGSYLHSRCEFHCDEHHWLSGPRYTTCIEEDGQENWNFETPTCKRVTCEMTTLKNGGQTCTDSNYVNSVCSYQCNENFRLFPDFVTSAKCLEDASWNISTPCCYRICPPQAMIDVIIMIDSSSSIGQQNWQTIKVFIGKLINTFVIGENEAQVGVFRYNRHVDSDSQILLNDYPNDKQGLLEAFQKIPYNGSGTFTGQALRHARNVLLSPKNGNRPNAPDYILLVTDGKSYDPIKNIAQQLHQDGVNVLVVGVVPPRGQLDITQLNQLVVRPKDLVIARSGFQDLNTKLFRELVDIVCTPGCL